MPLKILSVFFFPALSRVCDKKQTYSSEQEKFFWNRTIGPKIPFSTKYLAILAST